MMKEDLIFDWKKSESLGRDKLLAFVVVALLFAVFAGAFDLRQPALRDSPAPGAGLILFSDEGMARAWLLEAEENGPFPGRLEVDKEGDMAVFLDGGNLDTLKDYRMTMRNLPEKEPVVRAEITQKGKRVIPAIQETPAGHLPEVSATGETRRIPVLIPYDKAAQQWLPEKMPNFEMPAGAEIAPDSLRFAMSLREHGSVAELIPLAGGDDPAQKAMESWLRGLRFKEGTGERWFGLRVDFVNRREDVAEPQ